MSFTGGAARGSTTTETVMHQFEVPAGVVISPTLTITLALTSRSDPVGSPGSSSTFRVYVGSTTFGDTTGGTPATGTFVQASATDTIDRHQLTVANPGTTCYLQVTGQGADVKSDPVIEGIEIVLT
jgi:hypothetical protein